MMDYRRMLEDIEKKTLASYGMKSADTRGRKHPEDPPHFRTEFQRDRDRIIHSTAFRRLEYKTQVFVNHEGDYYRTRLTHTIEVQQVARTIARALRLNEDLAEAISLAHDIGHTPFGHAGEAKLHEIMEGKGGFEHNMQGLRVVDYLENKYEKFRGLNLTFETREGIAKHKTSYDNPDRLPDEFLPDKSPTLEAQIVNLADEIAYNAHDIDDGLKSGNITLEQILESVPLFRELYEKAFHIKDREKRVYEAIREFIGMQIHDVIENSLEMIKKAGVESVDDVRECDVLIDFSPEMREKNGILKKFLYENLYTHYKVIKMQEKAKRYIEALFNVYMENLKQLPPQFYAMLEEFPPERVVCDYIAGMTDRYAQDEYARLFYPFTRM